MAKLGNIFAGNIFRITQSPHGAAQDGRALDCTSGVGNMSLIAPCDVEVKAQRIDASGNPYFEIFNNNFKIQLVHCVLKVTPGIYAKGKRIGTYEYAGDKYPDHCHVAVQLSGKWYTYLDFLERNVQLTLAPGFKSQHWKNWNTWPDRQLDILSLTGTPPSLPEPPVLGPEVIKYENVKSIIIQP